MLPISLIVVFILTPIIGFLVSEKFQNSFIQSSLNYYSGVWPLVISLSIICLVISIVSGNFRKNSFETFLCIPIIVTMNAAFLSQGFYGSSYSLWPLWAILLVIIFNVLRKIPSKEKKNPKLKEFVLLGLRNFGRSAGALTVERNHPSA